jgi:acyl-coenzyme A synthetase/AMP-(fatty) acid ligase/aryl carrier-like protein
VIFTSGSTGVPKGVEVSHRALTNLLSSMAVRPGLSPQDTLIAVTTVSFDISILELLLPLVVGARLVLASKDDARDGFALLDVLRKENATVLQATPTSWRMLVEAGFKARTGFKMLCGGEPLPTALAVRLLEGDGELWNMYGPTETTIWSSTEKVLGADLQISIGRPIANTKFYVVDKFDQPVAPGVIGELVICGAGVANRYIGDTQQTAAKFFRGSFGDAENIPAYRTGDLARVSRDGRFFLLGRTDHQVKLNGYRIELGAIEAELTAIRGISQAAVAMRDDNHSVPYLAAYYTTERNVPAPAPEVIRKALASLLPNYMVPSSYMVLPALPLTTSGKVNRKALPVPETGAAIGRFHAALVPLATPWQKKLGAIWSEVLEIESIGAEDDILDLGADSIQVFQIVARARREGISLTAKDLMLHRNIGKLAAAFDHSGARRAPGETHALPKLSDFRRRAKS